MIYGTFQEELEHVRQHTYPEPVSIEWELEDKVEAGEATAEEENKLQEIRLKKGLCITCGEKFVTTGEKKCVHCIKDEEHDLNDPTQEE